ncbi:hypothetical protein E2C01_035197 [Portunus trituberculatus]|uniref:Uncharacterized protein n=1 Tax=Portunus trituberculatus TaxID=210409 RepID=A0A5B7F7T9_PORTR|nr:hypothetical protein [Portunus trituberculatus]
MVNTDACDAVVHYSPTCLIFGYSCASCAGCRLNEQHAHLAEYHDVLTWKILARPEIMWDPIEYSLMATFFNGTTLR